MVERRSGTKHILHISHFRCGPTPNGLVERRSLIKHTIHSSHLRCVPTPNGLVERRSGRKHISHISHFFCVPLRNVAVECTFTAKALRSTKSSTSTHIFHQTRIPIRHRSVIITRSPLSALAGNFGPCFGQTLRDKGVPTRIRDRSDGGRRRTWRRRTRGRR